jgi:hypothetical protein
MKRHFVKTFDSDNKAKSRESLSSKEYEFQKENEELIFWMSSSKPFSLRIPTTRIGIAPTVD